MKYKRSIYIFNYYLSAGYKRLSNRTFFLLLLLHFVFGLIYYKANIFNINCDLWQTQELSMNYSYGFVRRGLLGSLTHLIYNNSVLDFGTAAKIVQSLGIILFATAILLFFYSLIKYENDKTFCFIILVFISLHFWGFQLKQFALLDTYLMAITILIVYLITYDKALFLVPILACVCMLIHEGYPAMYFGVIISLLIYKYCYEKDRKKKNVYIAVFISSCITVSVLFLYFYFFNPRIKTNETESNLLYFKNLLGISDASLIKYLWFDTTIDLNSAYSQGAMWINGKPTPFFFKLIVIVLLNIALCSPLIYMTIKFWCNTIKAGQTKFNRFLLFLSSLPVFLITPLIILHCDQARWFYDIIFFEIVIIGSMFKMNYNNERKTLSKITKISISKVLILIFYFIIFINNYDAQLKVISVYHYQVYAFLNNLLSNLWIA